MNAIRKLLGLRPVRVHDRSVGPVVIDPDVRERVVVRGKA